MTSLNDVSLSRRHDDRGRCTSSFVVRLLSGVLRCFVGALAVLYAAKMAAILTVDQLVPHVDPVSAGHDDVVSTVTGSDVSRLLSDAETRRQRELWNVAASRRSAVRGSHDGGRLVDDADVGFSRLTSGDVDAFVWHAAGLEHRAVGQWGCEWRTASPLALEDVGVLTYGIAVAPRDADDRQRTTRASLNGALLQLERDNYFDTLHDK